MKIPYAKKIYDHREKENLQAATNEFWLTHGRFCNQFEKKFSEFIRIKHVLFVNSGSSANLLAFMALTQPELKEKRIKRGDEVITTACCFPTTLSPIVQYGAIPVFVDITIPEYNIDISQLEKAKSKKTKAVILAHTLGNPFNIKAVKDFCSKHDLWLIEDNCLIGNTKIKTINGTKKIKDIKRGDFVLTRNGYKEVIESEKTGKNKVIKRFGIIGTKDHPIITKKGIKKLENLNVSDILYIWNEKLSLIEAKPITVTQKLKADIEGFIFVGIQKLCHFIYIDKFGLIILEKYLKGLLFTTKMKTLLTTILTILNLLVIQHIVSCIQISQNILKNLKKILKNTPGKKLKNGIKALRVENGTACMQKNNGKTEKSIKKYVLFVTRCTKRFFLKGLSFVQENAKAEVEVYNLKIQDNHEFIANGVLVHNCDSLGAKYYYDGKYQYTGNFGDISTNSFYPAHHMTTGEGGAVCTNNDTLHKILLSLRDWGRECTCDSGTDNKCGNRFDNKYNYDHKYIYSHFGYNLKATEFQGAIGLAQLEKLKTFIFKRIINWKFFRNRLSDKYILPTHDIMSKPSWFGFVLTLKNGLNRNKLTKKLEFLGIQTRPIFAGNILRQPCFKDDIAHRVVEPLKNTNYVMENSFWFGVHPGLTKEQKEYIISNL